MATNPIRCLLFLLLCLVVSFTISPIATGSEPSSDVVDSSEIEDSVRELVRTLEHRSNRVFRRFRVPGVGIAILREGRLAWAGGFGYADLEKETPVTANTAFNIGSISKTIAAYGAMLLVERGKLSLDEPAETYLTRWKLPESEFDRRGVTLRRLLSHTAGLSLHGYPGFEPEDELPSIEESLSGDTNGSGDVHLISEPGSTWKYSGGGFTISQLMIEEVTGKRFEDFLREEILVPLGMTSSDYDWTEHIVEIAATPYDRGGDPIGGPRFTAAAAAGLQTTPRDLAKFGETCLANFREESSASNSAVLKPETLALMQSPAPSSPNYGLGFSVSEDSGFQIVGHGGANRGWMARLDLIPKTGDGLVVLTNASNGNRLHTLVYGLWLQWLKEETAKTD